MRANRTILALSLFAAAGSAAPSPLNGQQLRELASDQFLVRFAPAGIASLRHPDDTLETDYARPGRTIGDFVVHFRQSGDTHWSEGMGSKLDAVRKVEDREDGERRVEYRIAGPDGAPALLVVQTYRVGDERIRWRTELQNLRSESLEIGDLGFAFDSLTRATENVADIFERSTVKHHFVAGHGSYLWWERPNGVGPYLVMTPLPGTWLEYSNLTDHVRNVSQWPWFYVHSAVAGGNEARGTWRQQHTLTTLAPAGATGDRAAHGFTLRWADDRQGVRDVVYEEGLVDVTVMPGMTVPEDLEARIALRSHLPLSLEAEFPEETDLEYLGETQPDTHVYRVRFRQLGENALIVRWTPDAAPAPTGAVRAAPPVDAEVSRVVQSAATQHATAGDALPRDAGVGRVAVSAADGPSTLLEFFVTEPLETLIRKRSAHIVENQQHRDPSTWYDGLFSVWDMRDGGVLRGPDDTDGFDGWWGYVLATDDPALSKAPYVAAKNAIHPEPGEIAALEYHIEHFVWGGLQRTDEEDPYPYGVYGVPNWFENRSSNYGFGSGGKGLEHVWRMFDYPHVVMLYLNMHRIAERFPDTVKLLDADGYLERAWQTARAYFLYPYEILPWYEIYKWGTMNEVVLFELIDTLDGAGRNVEADWLRAEFDKKLKYMVYDDRYPFRSEYALDTTGFESTHAIAAWGLLDHDLQPTENLWFDKNEGAWRSYPDVSKTDVRDFLDRQIAANIALRGTLEPAYYYLGSDYRGSQDRSVLTYMSKMGGQAVLDYALRFAAPEDRAELVRVGYASILSSWALMNTSEDGSGGYWFDGPDNDGAAGWAFTPQKFGRMWIRKDGHRGPWYYDGEIDLGFGAYLRAAATIVIDDPVFGLVAYGGEVRETRDGLEITPRDGVRRQIWVLRDGREPLRFTPSDTVTFPAAPLLLDASGVLR